MNKENKSTLQLVAFSNDTLAFKSTLIKESHPIHDVLEEYYDIAKVYDNSIILSISNGLKKHMEDNLGSAFPDNNRKEVIKELENVNDLIKSILKGNINFAKRKQ